MKKIIVICIILGLTSCSMLGNIIDNTVYNLLEDVEFYDFADYDLTGITNFSEISYFVRENVSYGNDVIDEYYSVEETMKRGIADCEDFCFVFANLAYITMGVKMNIVVMNTSEWSRTVEEGGAGNHVVLELNGVYYSGQYGNRTSVEHVLYRYTFDEIFGGGY